MSSDTVGGRIAYSMWDEYDKYVSIFTIDSDGKNNERLTKHTDAVDFEIDWSPDGTKMVFTRGIGTGLYDIYLMNSDGTFIENLTNSPEIGERSAHFSPDGNKIVFSLWPPGETWDIFIMNSNGTEQENLTNTPDVVEFAPDWSPDGKKIVFVISKGAPSGIYIMDSDGANRHILAAGSYRHPAWSPDGKEIAFFNEDNNNMLKMNSDGSSLTMVAPWTWYGAGLSWSADGKRWAFALADDNFWPALAVINRDGTNLKLLTPHSYRFIESIAWSPWPLPW